MAGHLHISPRLAPTCKLAVCSCGARWLVDGGEDSPTCPRAKCDSAAITMTRVHPQNSAVLLYAARDPFAL